MQHLAAVIGFSETAFIMNSEIADFKVRFFTPCAEVDLCGHATIAAFGLLYKKGIVAEGEYTQETKAGILKIRIKGETIYMQQALPQFFEKINGKELVSSLGITAYDLHDELPIQAVSTGLKDIFIPLKNEEILKDLQPNMKHIEEISKKYQAVGYHVFSIAEDDQRTAVCRNFAPLYGIPEESATGTSNGALACYLQNYGKILENNKEIIFEQGIYMNKPSKIKARLVVEAGKLEEVWIGGEALLLKENFYQI